MHTSCCVRITEHTTAVLLHNWQVADTRAQQAGGVRGHRVSTALSSPSPEKMSLWAPLPVQLCEGLCSPQMGCSGKDTQASCGLHSSHRSDSNFPVPLLTFTLPAPLLCSSPLSAHTTPASLRLILLHQPSSSAFSSCSHSHSPWLPLLLPLQLSPSPSSHVSPTALLTL